MTNEKVGFYAAVITGLSTIIFALSMLMKNQLLLSFLSCMILAWAYIVVTCAFAAQANQNQKAFAYAGMAFACVYAVFITLVYYTQLTTVNQRGAADEIIQALTFEPGTWMFALDLLGYGVMAISTFFVGLTIIPATKTDKWLRTMLLLHGIFAPFSIVAPMLNLFDTGESESLIGVIVLEAWCLIFIPIMALATKHFLDKSKEV